MDFDSLKNSGSGLGTAGVIVVINKLILLNSLLDYQSFINMSLVVSVLHVGKEQDG